MLSALATTYIRLRRIGGFSFKNQAVLLTSFVRFATERGQTHVTTETAVAWAALGASPDAREARLRVVIAFARHCRAEDAAHEIPPSRVFGPGRKARRPVAYIFTPKDIRRLLAAALDLHPKTSLRPYTYHTLVGLLAATGLRIGEALALQVGDITPEGLFIRQTKFKKDRLVPLHATTEQALSRYLALRRLFSIPHEHVFVGQNGQPLRVSRARDTFLGLVADIGLATARGGRSPRLHDLRHTWAVRALEACPHQVRQVDRHMRAVTTYLGHVRVATGYWYLQATPLLMKRIADACADTDDGGTP